MNSATKLTRVWIPPRNWPEQCSVQWTIVPLDCLAPPWCNFVPVFSRLSCLWRRGEINRNLQEKKIFNRITVFRYKFRFPSEALNASAKFTLINSQSTGKYVNPNPHGGVARIALPNFEEILLKKSWSKVCLEKLCNPKEFHYKSFLLRT
jgi:hypothetical protein